MSHIISIPSHHMKDLQEVSIKKNKNKGIIIIIKKKPTTITGKLCARGDKNNKNTIQQQRQDLIYFMIINSFPQVLIAE